ncbi:MAG: sugar transferase [Planctomycetota bacterium]|jgi:lipopolysaccharide/colanic/teichoic acid biosynthesis glycosyltransferase
MKALVFALGECPEMTAVAEHRALPMLSLVDKPFIQHVVELLREQGITRIDFVLSHFPEQIEELLGEGDRFECAFHYHLVRDPAHAYTQLKARDILEEGGPVLLGHGERLPLPGLVQEAPGRADPSPVVFCQDVKETESYRAGTSWTGWAWITEDFIRSLPHDCDAESFEARLLACAREKGRIVTCNEPLSIQSYGDVLKSHKRVMGGEFPDISFPNTEKEDGIWVEENVYIDPTARLVPPVFIGENSRIGGGARIGPNTAIGRDCLIDGQCLVKDSVILPESHVGEALELTEAIVEKNYLVNTRLGIEVKVTDDFLLGTLPELRKRKRISRIVTQLLAAALLLFAWPVILATALVLKCRLRGPVLLSSEVLRLPADSEKALRRTFKLFRFRSPGKVPSNRLGLSHFLLQFLPGLVHVALGQMRFVGVPPRTREQVEVLPRDWRALYLGSKPGLVTESEVQYGACAEWDEQYAADGFYAVNESPGYDLKLFLRYCRRLFIPLN